MGVSVRNGPLKEFAEESAILIFFWHIGLKINYEHNFFQSYAKPRSLQCWVIIASSQMQGLHCVRDLHVMCNENSSEAILEVSLVQLVQNCCNE